MERGEKNKFKDVQHPTQVATSCVTSHRHLCACSVYSAPQGITYRWSWREYLTCSEAASSGPNAPADQACGFFGAVDTRGSEDSQRNWTPFSLTGMLSQLIKG